MSYEVILGEYQLARWNEEKVDRNMLTLPIRVGVWGMSEIPSRERGVGPWGECIEGVCTIGIGCYSVILQTPFLKKI